MKTLVIMSLLGLIAATPLSLERNEHKIIVNDDNLFPKNDVVYKSDLNIISLLPYDIKFDKAGKIVPPSSLVRIQQKIIVNDEIFFPKNYEVYKSDHDIINVLLPFNHINYQKYGIKSIREEGTTNLYVFFVEADIKSDGKRKYKGLYVLRNNTATKLLDNGKDMAASADDSKLVFLGASDGLYVYNSDKNVTEKYGPINDDIISIAKEYSGDVIYILTAEKKVYKVTDNGNVKEKIDNIVNAEQIVLDAFNNIYYYTTDKELYVYTSEGSLKKVSGLSKNITSITLIRSALAIPSVPCVIDYNMYMIYPNGTSTEYGLEYTPKYKPSAFAVEVWVLHYIAYDKKIYEYNYLKPKQSTEN